MATQRTFPGRVSLRRSGPGPVDILVGLGILALLYGAVKLGRSMTVTFTPGKTSQTLPTGLSHLPYYAARSLLRMFIALAASTAFTLAYATAAVRLRRMEKRARNGAKSTCCSFDLWPSPEPGDCGDSPRSSRKVGCAWRQQG